MTVKENEAVKLGRNRKGSTDRRGKREEREGEIMKLYFN